MNDGPYAHVAGHRFPGGTTTVEPWLNQLWCDAVCTEDTAPFVHPMLVYYMAVQGSGVTFQDIFDLLDGSTESGIMVGEQRLEFREPLRIGMRYEVSGGMTGVERKSGRRAGTFDIATFQLELRSTRGSAIVASTSTSFVFPRPEDTA
jgi:hypothetical protein